MNSKRQTISITDDDVAVLDGVQLILERAGYDTQIEINPRKLLDPDRAIPDLFVLDRQLSGIDGLDTCRYLKANAQTAHIPVIIVSATPHIARLAAEAGADGFLEKPFKGAELLGLIGRCLSPGPGN